MSEEPVLRFRNYVPRDAALAQHVVAPVLPAAPAAASGDAAPLPEPDAPVLLVPKRANWDLKRDIAPKLESLERMTQRAIAELVQSKVAAAASAAEGGGGSGSGSGSGSSSSGGGGSSSSAASSAGGAAGGAQQPQGESLDDVYAGPIDTALLSARVAALEAGEGQ